MKKFKLTDLLIFVVTAELVGALSALLAGDFTSFYSEMIRPPLSPPPWLFPVVWAILYALMGTSAYMIWNNRKNEIRRSSALRLYYIQLAVNFSWSIFFFRFRALGLAAAVAVILFLLVGAMILSFRRISSLAARLNIPYLVWLGFATYLAVAIYFLN
ncbi:TspO/MBR family protein [Ruminococcus flavefaciens]|uniref:TspO/MBR family protein n=1 Tax=Ruminococcus flavefaciens TaxID=1265 RepID=UPI0026EC029A|nr:TspO/MBR family protein [Ruminococcus flavefaciens]